MWIETDGKLIYTITNEDSYKMDNSETKAFCNLTPTSIGKLINYG